MAFSSLGRLPRAKESKRAGLRFLGGRHADTVFMILSTDSEGIPSSSGYREQYYDGLLDEAMNSRGYQRLFSAERLKAYRDSLDELKGNKQVCETTVALSQTLLLGEPSDTDHIVEAIRRIQAHSAALTKVG